MATLSDAELEAVANSDIRHAIAPETLYPIITSPPFIASRSMINLRDLGAVRGSAVKPATIYRCGTLDVAAKDPDAMAWLSNHVKRVFDLRRPAERTAAPDPEIPGVENVWFNQDESYPTPSLMDFALAGGRDAWKTQYMSVALAYKPTIKAMLEHVRDRPTEPFLFHCTAGRDRTGVAAGILQTLAGTSPENVRRDYMLSRIGIEPARDKLMHYALASVGTDDPETPGFYNLIGMKPEYWEAFMEGMQEKYGGIEAYVVDALGLSREDLEVIKKNLST